MDMSAILRRIEKLLAIANDSRADPNEAAAAASQAEKIMRKFNVDHADVLTRELREDTAEFDTVDVYAAMKRGDKADKYAKKNPAWAGWLGIRVAKVNDCEVRFARGPRGEPVVRFFGIKSDVQVAGWMFDYLVGQMVGSMRAWQAAANKTGYPRSKAESASYRTGFIITVCAALRKMEQEKVQEAQTAPTSGALILLSEKALAIAKRFGEFNYGEGRGTNISNEQAARAGAQAGAKVDVGRRGLGGTASATIALGN